MELTTLEQFTKIQIRATNQIRLVIALGTQVSEGFQLDGGDVTTPNMKDLIHDVARLAIVTSVAAMDDFFTRKFVEIVPKYIEKNGIDDNLANYLEEAKLGVKEALNLGKTKDYKREIALHLKTHLAKHTTQRTKSIDDLYSRLGLKSLSENSARKLGDISILDTIEEIVERRHVIVHSADLDSNGNLTPVKNDIIHRLTSLFDFVYAANEIIDNSVVLPSSIKKNI